jgi:hypothetical protein
MPMPIPTRPLRPPTIPTAPRRTVRSTDSPGDPIDNRRSVAVPERFRTAQNAITEGDEMAGYGQLAMATNGQILLSANSCEACQKDSGEAFTAHCS